jgi:hypothetical protein
MGLEDALAWAARYDFHDVDVNVDQPPNTLKAWDETRIRVIRKYCENHYMMAFGLPEDTLVGRDRLAACWHEA